MCLAGVIIASRMPLANGWRYRRGHVSTRQSITFPYPYRSVRSTPYSIQHIRGEVGDTYSSRSHFSSIYPGCWYFDIAVSVIKLIFGRMEHALLSPVIPKINMHMSFRRVYLQHCCFLIVNPLTPIDHYSGRTALLTSKRCILYIYSKNTGTEYVKHGIYCPFFSLQNAVCFIILTYLVPVLFTFYNRGVLKLKKK